MPKNKKNENLINAAKAVLNGHDQTGCDGDLTVCNSKDIHALQIAVFNLTGEIIGNKIEINEDEDGEEKPLTAAEATAWFKKHHKIYNMTDTEIAEYIKNHNLK